MSEKSLLTHILTNILDGYTIEELKEDCEFRLENLTKKKTKEERKAEFKLKVLEFRGQYSDDMLQDFFNYWTETGDKDTKLHFEKQKTFQISSRLSRWSRNNFGKKQQEEIKII